MRELLLIAGLIAADPGDKIPADRPEGTIAFSSLGPRGWDLEMVAVEAGRGRRLTDHPALDYNAAFSPDGKHIAFVSERDGNLELYRVGIDGTGLRRLTDDFALDDHPTWSPDGKLLAFVSTRRPSDTPGKAWNAVHVMNADGSEVRRLSPDDVADYSPAWSPKGDLIAFASGSGVAGGTALMVMKPDGGGRRRVVEDGGWPCFSADGKQLYFHSGREKGWGVWRVNLDGSGLERITAPDVEAFTPRASADGKHLVLAVKHEGRRRIELLDLASGKRKPLTQEAADHWNPSISPDGRHVVYHRSRSDVMVPNVERWGAPPETGLQLLRVAGAFPSFSPDHKRMALTGGNFARLDVMNLDGSERKTIYTAKPRSLFSVSWSPAGDRIAFGHGRAFEPAGGEVDIAVVKPDASDYRKLIAGEGNDAFPFFSPDGKRVVFRSGRDGSKNLYIADADGGNVRRLTEGKWTDTMPHWSHTGDRIAFASDREKDFEIWLIRPDGSGLKKLVAGGGRNNHPHFSPDGKWIVFTSRRAGYSAEEISLPSQPQPYGDLFAVRTDGTGLLRLTHNGFEEGTPEWGPVVKLKLSSDGRKGGGDEY